MGTIEKQTPKKEREHDIKAIERIGNSQREKIKDSFDQLEIDESQREKDAVSAKLEALQNADNSAAEITSTREASPASRRGPITKKQLDSQFNRTMEQVREELPASGRIFSRFIHSKPIEKASDALSSTIARPNALLTGAVCAFLLTLALYLFAKNMGYRLSGFETIGTFAVGWFLGILYDYLKIMITGKKGS